MYQFEIPAIRLCPGNLKVVQVMPCREAEGSLASKAKQVPGTECGKTLRVASSPQGGTFADSLLCSACLGNEISF